MKILNLPIVAVLLLVTSLIFYKIFLNGLYPVPGNLLVSFYFPFYSGSWEGFNPWVTHKEQFGADAIRQIYLWKNFAFDQFKVGEFPLWNPYTFSGQPLLANFQSSVFYPLNIFYFIFDSRNAWILQIVSIPFLAGLFTYLAIRSFGLNKISAIFGSISLMFSSYVITWMENGNVIHSYIWLPLVIWSANEYFKNFKLRYIFILILSISMSILAGHPQTVLYIYMVLIIFWFYKIYIINKNKLKPLIPLLVSLTAPLFLTAVQLIPTIDFYRDSPISLPFNAQIFEKGILPYKNLVTFLAPDFFGHPASENFWSFSYGDFTPYIGVLPFILAIWAIKSLWKEKIIRFSTFMVILFIISSTSSPITWAIKTFEVPLLDATFPARFLSISIFFLVILAAFGFNNVSSNIQNKEFFKKFIKFLSIFFVLYLILELLTFIGPLFLKPQEVWTENLIVSRRNLIIPIFMYLSAVVGVIAFNFLGKIELLNKKYLSSIFIAGIFIITIFGGMFYSNKFLPVSPKYFIFPQHPMFDWLKQNAGINRFYGGGTARVDFNIPIQYQVYVAEGYDTLRLKRYAELLAAARNDGVIPNSYLRSDAAFSDNENKYRLRLFDLLGVKYLLDKEDNPTSGEDWHFERYAADDIFGKWQLDKFLIYERRKALPRIFLTSSYKVAISDTEIINDIFNPNYNLTEVILEQEPSLDFNTQKTEISIPELKQYDPNKIIIETNNSQNSLLFISDAYSKDWKVTIDDVENKILRANYAFRAVEVPKVKHNISFIYSPISFTIGLYISLLSILILILSITMLLKKNKL